MKIIDINHYRLPAWGVSSGFCETRFVLKTGEVVAVTLEVPDDGHLFLRALATLVAPISGTYHFNGQLLEFNDYHKLLSVKRKIGYVGADAALISNRTVLENLLFMRYYFENSLSIELDKQIEALCDQCGLLDKLSLRPAGLNPLDAQLIIFIRELAKNPVVLLLDRPEDIIIPSKNNEGLMVHLEKLISKGLSVVMLSYEPEFISRFATKVVQIRDGRITENLFGDTLKET